MANPNPFKNVALDRSKVQSALESIVAASVSKTEKNQGASTHYAFSFNGKPLLFIVFNNKDGKSTLGAGTGNDAADFATVAAHVVKECGYGAGKRLEVSFGKFASQEVQRFLDFLTNERQATVQLDDPQPSRRQVRLRGPAGDTLTVVLHSNGTLQLQGVHAQMAGWALDFLRLVVPLDEMLRMQTAVYELPVTVTEIKSELVNRIPHAHDGLADEVRIQLSSALALTKVGIQLEDYAALAFPALRGLEGFCLQVLQQECGCNPPERAKLGDYFDAKTSGQGFLLKSAYTMGIDPVKAEVAAECYTLWQRQRHRLFHMNGNLETTTILDERQDAISLVDDVMSLVDYSYKRLTALPK